MQIVLPLSELDPSVDMSALMAELDDALGLVSGVVFDTPRFERPEQPAAPDPDLQVLPGAGTQRQKVLLTLLSNPGGLTRDELALALNVAISSINPRVLELREGGFITESGEKRAAFGGKNADVLVATEKARRKVRLATTKWLASNARPEGC